MLPLSAFDCFNSLFNINSLLNYNYLWIMCSQMPMAGVDGFKGSGYVRWRTEQNSEHKVEKFKEAFENIEHSIT